MKRWIERDSGATPPTSVSHRSCSSPPPTSTAPTSVSSQASPARPFVSVSTTRNSVSRSGASSKGIRPLYDAHRTVRTRHCAGGDRGEEQPGHHVDVLHEHPSPHERGQRADVEGHPGGEQHAGATAVPSVIPGFTDAHYWSQLGTVCYGFSPVRLQPGAPAFTEAALDEPALRQPLGGAPVGKRRLAEVDGAPERAHQARQHALCGGVGDAF